MEVSVEDGSPIVSEQGQERRMRERLATGGQEARRCSPGGNRGQWPRRQGGEGKKLSFLCPSLLRRRG